VPLAEVACRITISFLRTFAASSSTEWPSGIRIENWHRPLASYMRELLAQGLTLTFFDEPQPRSGDAVRQKRYRRAPWFMVMEWTRSR